MIDSLKKYYYRHQEQNIHALKYAVAFAAGYLTILFLKNPYSVAWVLITIAVVMAAQPIIGQQVLKSLMRLLGTLIGAFLGVIAFHLPHYPVILFIFIVCIAFFLARFAATKDPEVGNIAVLGMVTFSLIALLPHSNMNYAVMRVVDISIGIAISLLVSRFVFPLNARRALIFESMRTVDLIAQFIQKVFIERIDRQNSAEVNQLDAMIVKSMTKERAIIRSGRYESLRTPKLKNQFNQLVRYLRSIFHYLLFVDVALVELSASTHYDPVLLRQLLDPVMEWMMAVFHAFTIEEKLNPSLLDWPAFQSHVAKVKEMVSEKFPNNPSQAGAILFALDRMPHCFSMLVQSWNDIQAN
ncbi:MAG: hypothetical protein COY58_08770 [Gammaproteobacteria bacterium CG_4_10_14_0_8_um_filter_38_16]|nr:MAG: hypothetical protein COY58_08770 [Gammaproteobacteria bacterium CG_4_10_14_0_8_um_filter_38_16]PJA02919.1 MAG: hypothetical protein COX72_07795 [Gammaproteobacteria bacterium CG_4_10_14_0_2_um_filter_38_22]PJB11414.1 MAG: hypothetical protein CO120_00445 [Gammaproteobacteria bacterium CG_4_9_14_3_um_filter_38_9]